jgi:outer membrane protein assembly factor BamB
MVELNSPVVSGGKVYLGCRSESGDLNDSGIICCDAASGATEWFAPISGGVALAPAVAGGVVMVTAMTDSAYGFDADSGLLLWRRKAPGNRYKLTAPIFEASTAWIGGEPAIQAINPASGQMQWTSEPLGAVWYSAMYTAPAIGPDYIYCGFYGTLGIIPDGLTILNRQSGTALYRENGVYRSPICAGDTVFVVGGTSINNQVVTARDAQGSVLWSSSKLLDQGTGAPALGNGVLVVVGSGGRVEGFRATDGANLWSRPVLSRSLYDMTPNRLRVKDTIGTAAIADSTVYIGSCDGNLYTIDLGSGTMLSRFDLGVPIASSPALSGNMLFVGASDGHLYAFVGNESRGGPAGPQGMGDGSLRFFALDPPRPNPSSATVHLGWLLPRESDVQIDVLDLRGRLVKRVLKGRRAAGEGLARWDGRDTRGDLVAPGIYVVRLQAGDLIASRKLVRLRVGH